MLEVLVVHIVKDPGSDWVHVDGYRGVHILGAHSLQLGHICLVDCGVHWSSRGEIVNAVGELAAMRESKGMCRCIKNNIQMEGKLEGVCLHTHLRIQMGLKGIGYT